jgi:hypothetical protein
VVFNWKSKRIKYMSILGTRDSGRRIVFDGLKIWYDLSQLISYPTTGTVLTDLTGNLETGTLLNGPTFSTTNGGCLTFDRSDDVVHGTSTTNSLFAPATGFTIGSWVYPEFTTDDFNNTQIGANIAGRGNPTSGGDFTFILGLAYGSFGVGSVRGIVYMYDMLNSFGTIGTTNRWTNNAWNFIMAGHSGTTVKIWINGTHIGTITGIQSVYRNYTTHKYILGMAGANSLYKYRGKIASSFAYNRLLTDAEVLQNYNATRVFFGL